MAATHTFLKKNPDDYKLVKNMNYYKTLLDVEEYLIDHEEQPYEVREPTPRRRLPPPASPSTCSLACFSECFPKERDALQQRRLQQQCPEDGGGPGAVF